jgi:DNA-binding MarR family transcriptional regulator
MADAHELAEPTKSPIGKLELERLLLDAVRRAIEPDEIENLKQRVGVLETENAELRAKIPQDVDVTLSAETSRVLVHLFRAREIEDRDVGAISSALGMEKGLLKYHLDHLQEAELADVTGGDYLHGHLFWVLTPAGRQYVVERKLI